MNVGDFLDYDQIRHAMGLDESDLSDEILRNQGLEDDLVLATLWMPDDMEVPKDSRAEVLMRVFVKNWAAAQIILVSPNFALKQLTDGEDGVTRQTIKAEDYLALSDRFADRAKSALTVLLQDMGITLVTPKPVSMFSISRPDRDPVIQGRDGQVVASLALGPTLWPMRGAL